MMRTSTIRHIPKRPQVPTEMRNIPGHRPAARWGAKLPKRVTSRVARDVVRSSDVVWSLVEKLMAGDATAAVLLDTVIGHGFVAGKTHFVRVTAPARRFHGREHAAEVVPGEFAAITPGRRIVLFGIKDRRDAATGTWQRRGYVSRYAVGDAAVYHSFNIAYIGKIVGITDKRIATVDPPSTKKTMMTVALFSAKNWDPETIPKAVKRNAEWLD